MPAKKIIAAMAALVLLTSCGRDLSSDTYTEGATSGKVLKGTIISARAVKVKAHDKLQDNTLGGLAGGAAGGVGGASIGKGNGSIAGAIGGAVAGAVIGALAEDALSTSEGMEYIVQVDGGNTGHSKDTKRYKSVKASTKGKLSDDINNSIDTDLSTDTLSVVQKADPELHEGSRVYIIYHDDRPRLTPIKKAS